MPTSHTSPNRGSTDRGTRRLSHRVHAAQAGARLDHLLGAVLPGALGFAPSRAAVRRLVMAGAVRVNGRPVRRPAETLRTGDRIDALVDPARLRSEHRALRLTAADVLYEDAWLLAVDKPPGVPTHATVDRSRPDLHRAVLRLLAERSGADPAAAPRVGVHHRLDVDTSGVVLFSVDPDVNGPLGRLFAERRVAKSYLAAVAGDAPPPLRWTIRNHLGPVGRVGRKTRHGAVRAGGDRAQTDLVRLGRWVDPSGRLPATPTWLVEAHPLTGRTHQVRAHLAEAGWPIVGDELYGGPAGPRVLLHAAGLAFPHPVDGHRVVIESAVPDDIGEGPPARRARDRGSDEPGTVGLAHFDASTGGSSDRRMPRSRRGQPDQGK